VTKNSKNFEENLGLFLPSKISNGKSVSDFYLIW
jgi:hypothetical protein